MLNYVASFYRYCEQVLFLEQEFVVKKLNIIDSLITFKREYNKVIYLA